MGFYRIKGKYLIRKIIIFATNYFKKSCNFKNTEENRYWLIFYSILKHLLDLGHRNQKISGLY